MRHSGIKLGLGVLLLGSAWLATPIPEVSAVESAPPSAAETPIDAQAVAELIERAEVARSRAAELRAEWLETASLIEQARQEYELGNLQRAAELAELARQQGELSAAQAERESLAWQRRVVR